MATKVGIGHSEKTDSYEAGLEATRMALTEAGSQDVQLAMIFSTSRYDPKLIQAAVRSLLGVTPRIVGGYAVGIITRDLLAYDGYQLGIAVFASDSVAIDLFIESGLTEDEYKVGVALGNQIKGKSYSSDPNVLLLYDSVNRLGKGLRLNMATPLLEGMQAALNPLPNLAGAGLVGDMQCRESFQWFDDRIAQHSAIALVLSGKIQMDTAIMHGCRPASSYYTITKTDGPVVLEIEGRPALDVIADLLGPESGKTWRDYSFFVTLGVNKGEKWGYFNEDEYANRLCMRVDKDRKGLVMFEPDLKPGSEIQLMYRSMDFKYIARKAEALLERIEAQGRRPIFAFYIDCAGRAAAYSGLDEEEATEVQKAIASRMPLLGIYAGVEIGKVRQDVQALDWTGVLCVFSE
ncbi:MAG: FIST C-terminal domain-containing protein [Kastovskya adunca ATA6-11-RM4]|jgi:hypothetical protein|nr:FIST C-terminal domain-containing protein [Kastovskya adunca ATA6-11-RM4]